MIIFTFGLVRSTHRKEKFIMGIKFFDYDDVSDSDVIIKGKSFQILLDICFEYSKEFSFSFDETNHKQFPTLDAYMIRKELETPYHYESYPTTRKWIKFYRCCEKAKQAILNITDDFWKLCGAPDLLNPEDLTFYRQDKSVFFCSRWHEGYGTFYPRRDEDVSAFFKAVDFHTEINTIQIVEDRYQ